MESAAPAMEAPPSPPARQQKSSPRSAPAKAAAKPARKLPPLSEVPLPAEGERLAALEEIRMGASACRACDLAIGRRNTVAGEGVLDADVLFIHERPEEEDDAEGNALRGKLGELFWKIAGAMKLERGRVYISPAVKCRPMGGRPARPAEVRSCAPWLEKTIEQVRPRVIVCFGEEAFDAILPDKAAAGIRNARGRLTEYRGIPVMPTFGLDYINRHPRNKHEVWKDMQEVMGLLG